MCRIGKVGDRVVGCSEGTTSLCRIYPCLAQQTGKTARGCFIYRGDLQCHEWDVVQAIQLTPELHILINGASGGIGTFCMEIEMLLLECVVDGILSSFEHWVRIM
jgi:NADPH:quinone reductase-like Zn-dependent oxidoreductase